MLRNGTTVVDVIGQIGSIPVPEWGTGLTTTADNTLRRKAKRLVSPGDIDGTNVFDPSGEWDGFANDNVADLGTTPWRRR